MKYKVELKVNYERCNKMIKPITIIKLKEKICLEALNPSTTVDLYESLEKAVDILDRALLDKGLSNTHIEDIFRISEDLEKYGTKSLNKISSSIDEFSCLVAEVKI